jgi:hypothetical protein
MTMPPCITMPEELHRLIERYCRLGAQLPENDDVVEDMVDEVKLLLEEMAVPMRAIDTLIADAE